ncbi:AI-2E family transporter [Terrihabitans soli]|uniref:AI-2E family transporter n=1 Tax=Terrihabitans soli TaxID=708113 RepID=A0A6S6QWA7_9HYPH|nr:AI-2E family transporter [Terrihabitans soli]BCJ90798.1 AI-2E family transporter [Terrihabitans soli]
MKSPKKPAARRPTRIVKVAPVTVQEPVIVSATGILRTSIIGIFLMMAGGALYFAQDLLIPLCLAFVLSVLLSPIVRGLLRLGIPEGVSATLIVLTLLALIAVGGWSLSGPVSQWIDDAPRIGAEIQQKLTHIRGWFGFVQQVSNQVDQMAGGTDPDVMKVVLKEPGLLKSAATGVPEVITKIGLTLFLLLFLLASGDLFREKLVKVLPTLSDKKRAVHISRDIEREVSRYLLTITGINIATGVMVGLGLWAIGMPNPLLWGVLATFLTYIPYLGAAIGIALVGAVAIVSFDTFAHALLAPAVYLGVATLEGQVLTPMIVGRRLEMNAVAILVAVAVWAWLWGVIGALIAVPFLVIIKVISFHVESMEAVGRFLGARETSPAEDTEKAA